MFSVLNCESLIERWMSAKASGEVVKITVEDNPRKRHLIRWAHSTARNPRNVRHWTEEQRRDLHLPFAHIIDAVAFEDKRESQLLQLADACMKVWPSGRLRQLLRPARSTKSAVCSAT
jgi:hypothetical protein